MSDPGPSRSRARGGDRLPTSGNSAPARVARPPDGSSAPAAIPGKAKKGKKRRHRPGSKGGPSPAGQSTSSAGPSTTEATGGKRKRRQGASEPTPSDDDGSNADADTDNVGSAVEEAASIADEGKGKERDRRGRSKRSRSSVELEPGQATSPDEAGPSTTSPFFASSRHAAGRLSAVGTPTTEAEEDLEEVEVNLAASRNAGSLPLSALALGLRTAASPAPPGSPARSSRTSPVKVTTVSPTKHIAKKSAVSPAAVVASTPATAVVASPAKPSVDPALRERAVRLKLIEDLAKEKREREQEVAGMREEMDQLRKEVGFKDSALMSERETLTTVKHSLTCSICMELLYQPFLISPCGHTACFTCLKSWFLSPPQGPDDEIPLPPARQPKSCPSCRGPVVSAPTPVFLIKDLVHSIGPSLRALNGEDPSIPAPREVSTDRDPWDGLFDGRQPGEGLPKATWDADDLTWRCPDCFHEVAEGECSGCGAIYDNSEFGDEDRSADGDDLVGRLYPYSPTFFDEDDEQEDDSGLDGFIVGSEDEGEDEDEDESDRARDVLLELGASSRMIRRFNLKIHGDEVLAQIKTEDPRSVVEFAIPFDQSIERASDDRDGSRWLAHYLDHLPDGSMMGALWEEEKRQRRRPFRETPEWRLDEVFSDENDEDEDSLTDSPDDPRQSDSEEEDEELPAAYISDDELEIVRARLRQRRATLVAALESDEAEVAESNFAPRRRSRGRLALDSSGADDSEVEEVQPGSDDSVPVLSQRRRRHAGRIHSSPSSVASSHRGGPAAYLIDEGSDNDPETRSPSLVDDDEDRDEDEDDEYDLGRRRRRDEQVFGLASDDEERDDDDDGGEVEGFGFSDRDGDDDENEGY